MVMVETELKTEEDQYDLKNVVPTHTYTLIMSKHYASNNSVNKSVSTICRELWLLHTYEERHGII